MKQKLKIGALALLAALLLALGTSALAAKGGLEAAASKHELVKGGLIGRDVVFTLFDFEAALGVSGIEAIVIRELPAPHEGTLTLGGKRVEAGQRITARQIPTLTFAAATPMTTESTFVFRAENVSLTDMTCRIRLTEKMNYAPSIAHLTDAWLSVSTQTDLKINGRLTAHDPEGDKLTYLAVSYPENGSLLLRGDEYCYTPRAGFKGSDSFSYVVRDEYGNYSTVATVTVKVRERAADYTYADMEEDSRSAAALTMEAMEIMQGKVVGDRRYFLPSENVSLSDFVVMAMKAIGIRPLSTETFYDNNEDIPEAIRGYIARAQRGGYIVGDLCDGKLVFPTDETVTRAEAAIIVSRMLGLEGNETKTVFADADSIPARAEEAVYTLYDLGILPTAGENMISASEPLTRGACAEMLHALIEQRN